MKVVITFHVPEIEGQPPPFVRLRRAIKYLLRAHRMTVRSIRPVKEKAA